MAGLKRPLFVLLGASMVEFSFRPGGWGAAIADLYSRKVDVLLRGYRGWNTRRIRDALPHFFPKDSPVQPALVVVFIGTNDAAFPVPSGKGQYVPIEEFADNLRHICSYLTGLSDATRVILITPPPVNEDARRILARAKHGPEAEKYLDRSNDRASEYARVSKFVGEELGVAVLDLYNAIAGIPNWRTTCLSDGMHLSQDGNALLLAELLKILKNTDWTPSLDWEKMPNDRFCEPHEYDLVHPYLESKDYVAP